MKTNARLERDLKLAQRPGVRRWCEIERYMESARNERSANCAAALSAVFGKVRLAFMLTALAAGKLAFGRRPRKAVTAIFVAASAAIATVAIGFPTPADAQEWAANTERRMIDNDTAVLTAFGLNPASIEKTNDLERLWRAVRELVLLGRVSEETQRRILRRVWVIDPEIENDSSLASDTH